jgi:hypothetical protein
MRRTSVTNPDHRSDPQAVRNVRGLALVATLLVLAVMGIVVAAAVRAALTSVRASSLEYNEARAFYAAEAGGEGALSQLELALQDGFLSDEELEEIRPPDLEDFSFDSFSVEKRGEVVVETITDGPFAGLYALTQNVDIYSLAEDESGTQAGVILRARAQAIPIFQFGVFYEEDLEATNGPPMVFEGRVHSNGNIFLSSANAWYREVITTPNEVYHDRKDHHKVLDGVFVANSSATDVLLDFDSRSRPSPEAFKAESCEKFDCRLQTNAFGVDSLRLPLPDEIPVYELIRPREAGDTDSERSVKFAWNADTYITVDLTQANNGLCAGGGPAWPQITVQRDGAPVPDAASMCAIFPWTWTAFFDGREDEFKDVLNINVAAMAAWAGTDETAMMQLIYVEFIGPADIDDYLPSVRDVILDGNVDPAVRMINGAILPNPMTVATEWPLYVLANYNSAPGDAWRPAALAGDGITIQSTDWRDDQNRPAIGIFTECASYISQGSPCDRTAYENWVDNWDNRANRRAGETTVMAAILAGHWATPCDHHAIGCDSDGSEIWYADWYGGGIENFPRFVEEWRQGGTRVILTYRGALISPYRSQKTTGTWNIDYYVPPQRNWSFETRFRDPRNLPPGTPNVGNVVRTAMREAF